jgi:hypothetical protein
VAITITSTLFQAKGWLADAFTAIENSQQNGGILGALQSAKRSPGSINTLIYNNAAGATALSNIAQSSVQDATTLVFQQANAVIQQRALDKAKAAQLTATPPAPLKQLLDPFIYFSDGSFLDTDKNILTKTDGTQIDTTTGANYVEPGSLIQMANGAYLDTKNNILTLPDGTKINTITGLTVSTTA